MGMFVTAFRIRLSGTIGGIFFMAIFAFAIVGIITSVLSAIQDHIVGKESAAGKVIDIIETILWIGTIILIILDVTGIFHSYSTILFALFDSISK